MLEIDYEIPWGFFNRACQGHPLVCGPGVVLFLNHSHYLHVRYAPGVGIKDRVEFIAL
jgi:hypothetical protein